MWKAVLLLLLALLYVVIPWDFDFVPVFGRIDDIINFLLALRYFWKRKQLFQGRMPPGGGGQGRAAGKDAGSSSPGKDHGEDDPYQVLGKKPGDDEETIRKAYRELLGKYHPDRVQHLGEEFREIALQRTKSINLAWQDISKERNFT